MSLPHLTGPEIADIPAHRPYLKADPARVRHAGAELSDATQPRIGLVWRGSAAHDDDSKRSIGRDLLKFAGRLKEVAFVSLQLDATPAEKRHLDRYGIIQPEMHPDFAATAALIENLDLTITVDTSVAHLAGGLDRPVWTLVSHVPDWRWLRDRDDTPWYPSMRLFRQPAVGDWSGLLENLESALRAQVLD